MVKDLRFFVTSLLQSFKIKGQCHCLCAGGVYACERHADIIIRSQYQSLVDNYKRRKPFRTI